MRERSRHLTSVGLLLCAAVVFAPGCRLIKKLFPSEEIELADAQEATLAPQGDRAGLEVRLMVVDDTFYDAPRALRDLGLGEAPAPEPEGARQRWRDWGFRLVTIERDEVEGLLASLRGVQPSSVQWLGEFGAWRPVVRAGSLSAELVRVGDGVTRIERGRPVLIARSWVEPVLGRADVEARVRLDLGMQIASPVRPGAVLIDQTRPKTLDDDGRVIDELLCSLWLTPDRALVIVGEAPDTLWDELAVPELIDETLPPPPDEGEPDEGLGPRGPRGEQAPDASRPAGDDAGPARGARPAFGASEPKRPVTPTLGELMLTSPGSRIVRANETRVLPKRVIVVLIPSAGGEHRLLPARGARAGQVRQEERP